MTSPLPVRHRIARPLEAVFAGAVCLVVFAITLLPPLFLLSRSLFFSEGFDVLTEGRQWSLLLNSLLVAGGTAVLATILGFVSGWSVEYLRIKTSATLKTGMLTALLIPPYISAVAWIDLLGSSGWIPALSGERTGLVDAPFSLFSVVGTIFVLGLSYYPVVLLTTLVSLRRLDRRMQEAAEMTVQGWPVFRSIVFPLLAPMILTGSLGVFVLALTEFAVPSLLQVNVYPVEIFSRFSAFYDFDAAALQSLPLIVLGLGGYLLWVFLLRPRYRWLSQAYDVRNKGELRGSATVRLIAMCFCWMLVTVSVILPVVSLLYRALPLTSFVEAWNTAKEEMGTSFAIAALSASLAMFLAFSVSWLQRSRTWVRWTSPLMLLPFLVSGPVLGIGLIALWNRSGPAAVVYDGLAILVIACCAKFLWFAWLVMSPAVGDLPRQIEEAAEVAGIPWWRRLRAIALPLSKPALVVAWMLCFLLSFREVDATVLVSPPGVTPLPIRVFTLMHYGPSRLVAALSLVSVFAILGVILIGFGIYRKSRRHSLWRPLKW